MATNFSETFLDDASDPGPVGCPEPYEGTVLVADLRGVGTTAKPQEQGGGIENTYLGMMSDAVIANDGTVVSYIGGGMLAVFSEADHSDAAVSATVAMLDSLERFNQWARADGLAAGFRIGIGVNSGPVLPAQQGCEPPRAVGETTSTAVQLERMTRETRHQALVSGATRARLRRPGTLLRYVDEDEVGAEQADLEVWAVMRPQRSPDPSGPRRRRAPRRPRAGVPSMSVVGAA